MDRVCAPQVPGGEAGVGSEPGVLLLLETLSGCQRMGSAVRRGRDRSCLCACIPWASWGAVGLEGFRRDVSSAGVVQLDWPIPPGQGPPRPLWESEALALPVFPTPHASLQPQGGTGRVSGPQTEPRVKPGLAGFLQGQGGHLMGLDSQLGTPPHGSRDSGGRPCSPLRSHGEAGVAGEEIISSLRWGP